VQCTVGAPCGTVDTPCGTVDTPCGTVDTPCAILSFFNFISEIRY